MDKDIFYDFSELCMSLCSVEDDWCKDRIVHLGIFNCILTFTREIRYGAWIAVRGLRCILTIFDSYEEDPERKDIVMAQFSSTQIHGESGLEIIEQLYQEENEEIIDLSIEILDSHFGYDDNGHYKGFYEEDTVFS